MTKLFSSLPKPHKGLIAHRGAGKLAPENTLSAFRKAAEMGINWVEFDIQRCLTGEWIVLHDDTLDRTTNAKGLISETPYKKIQLLDAGAWFSPQFRGEPIPLLKDVLCCLQQYGLHPNIDIKPFEGEKQTPMQDFISQLAQYWPSTLPLPLVSSFDLTLLDILRALHPRLPLGLITTEPSLRPVDIVLEHQLDSLHIPETNVNSSILALAKEKALPLLAFTINEPKRIRTLLQSGITAVFSDLTDNIFSLV